jgi:hypothetical protein
VKVDITELLIFFDEVMPSTDEEQKVYWFRTTREDQTLIIFVISIFEESVGIIIKNSSGVCFSHLDFENCSEIKVLDQERKCLEVLSSDGHGRCFLSLLGDSILSYNEFLRE